MLYMIIYTFMCTFIGLYFLVPALVKFYPPVVTYVIFFNAICQQTDHICSKLKEPKKSYNLEGVENFYVDCGNGSKIGLWVISPLNIERKSKSKVILYCHGNSYHRGYGHRLSLYLLLRRLGFWVVTFDYRGYADSTGEVTEAGAVEDIITIYQYIESQFSNIEKILVWSHSLGTSFASRAVSEMTSDKVRNFPAGLILEAPFNCIQGIMENYPMSKALLRFYPGNLMKNIVLSTLRARNISLNTSEYLQKVNCNVMILHAEDDNVVHYKLGRALFDHMREIRDILSPAIKFVKFTEKHGLGHNGIYQHPDVPRFIEEFMRDTSMRSLERFSEVEV